MQRPFKHTIKTEQPYFMTMTVVEWIDVFSRKNHRDAFIDSLKYCQENKGLIVFAYVIMTNHVHLIANTNEPFLLKDVIRDLKKFTSKKIVEQTQSEPESRRDWMLSIFGASITNKHTDFKFWQEGSHAIELYSEKFIWTKINYIHNNPVTAGFVKSPEEWVYSSASNYSGSKGILHVDCIRPRLITF